MKHITITLAAIAALTVGCVDDEETFRDNGRGRIMFLDDSLDLIGFGTEPPEDHQVCCENGSCSPAVKGACPQGGVLHNCSDVEICNDDGSACWYECEPASPPTSSVTPMGVTVGPSPHNEPCGTGICCSNCDRPSSAGSFCVGCKASAEVDCDGTWLSCDAGSCYSGEDVCDVGPTYNECCVHG